MRVFAGIRSLNWWKLARTGPIAVLGAGVAIVSADPVRSPRRGLRWIVVCAAAA
jgi:hypothetical protein